MDLHGTHGTTGLPGWALSNAHVPSTTAPAATEHASHTPLLHAVLQQKPSAANPLAQFEPLVAGWPFFSRQPPQRSGRRNGAGRSPSRRAGDRSDTLPVRRPQSRGPARRIGGAHARTSRIRALVLAAALKPAQSELPRRTGRGGAAAEERPGARSANERAPLVALTLPLRASSERTGQLLPEVPVIHRRADLRARCTDVGELAAVSIRRPCRRAFVDGAVVEPVVVPPRRKEWRRGGSRRGRLRRRAGGRAARAEPKNAAQRPSSTHQWNRSALGRLRPRSSPRPASAVSTSAAVTLSRPSARPCHRPPGARCAGSIATCLVCS